MNIHHVLFFCFLPAQLPLGEVTGSIIAAFTTFPTTRKQHEQQSTEETTATDYSLVVVICVTLVCVAQLAVFLLQMLYKWRSKKETDGLNNEETDSRNMEFATYENLGPLSRCEDSTYQSLDFASRDQDQIYSTLPQDVYSC